jgi:phosphatidylethanolamine/phosphatidyl-N-methylethanolamine N-methyltransferase
VESQLQQKRQSAHRGAFFRSWLQDPFHVASVVPSSRWLARLMATDLDARARVVELGAGTGTLTEAILQRGVKPQNLYLVEQHDAFASILRMRFPSATVVQSDAAALPESLGALAGTIDYVISGLPIVWFNREKKTQILQGALQLLRPNGRLHQFTYLGRPPIGNSLLESLRLKTTLLGLAPINLPPAFVYRFERA